MGRRRMPPRGRRIASALALAVVASAAPAASAQDTSALEQLPATHASTPRGSSSLAPLPSVVPTPKTVDGDISDWTGSGTGFGGTVVHDRGELVYTDHIFDSWGSDEGADARRKEQFRETERAVPQARRLESLGQNAPDELKSARIWSPENYGDAGFQPAADLLELRLASDGQSLHVLARTTTMAAPTDTAVLLLADTVPGGSRDAGFNSGITTGAEVAVLLAHGAARAHDLAGGTETAVEAKVNPSGFVNAIEAAVPLSLLGAGEGLKLSAATGLFDPATSELKTLSVGPNPANVAFRTDEPVRTWFDQRQAIALHSRSIDDFSVDVDIAKLSSGHSERYSPGPGYHDRVFTSSEAISSEGSRDGIHQHYGLYLPEAVRMDSLLPLTFWMHWRGGNTHGAGNVVPRVFADLGEANGSIVVAPRGRGTSTWYLGEGHADFNEVWDDATRLWPVDRDRVYVSGHSMGGWASYLLSILYPDRFAAAFSVAAPVTQGAWTGLDFPGCDSYASGGSSPCYVQSNDGDARTQHTRKLLDNVRNVPLAIFHGAADELVPVSGVTRQVEKLVQLGYRHRYYVFPNYEHYTHPALDQWAEGARYLASHRRDPNPAHVTYVRDMAFERTVETGPSQRNPQQGLAFDFDRAYWMSDLAADDPAAGVARFDGRTHARPQQDETPQPEAGGPAAPGQTGPYTMTGLSWPARTTMDVPAPNLFSAKVSGAASVKLDLARMGLQDSNPVIGFVEAGDPVELRLAGSWVNTPSVTVDGQPATTTLQDGLLSVALPAGASEVVVRPT